MLKAALAAAGVVFLATAQARAGILVTGAIRDRSGSPVAGAQVAALDAAGRTVGTDVAAADGTFALDARVRPLAVRVACDYCEPMRAAVIAGEPVVVIVDRFTAVTVNGPDADDIRALPYRGATDVASLIPFTDVTGDRIADRGLDRYGALTIGGLPFYDPLDGSTAGPYVPAHAVATLTVRPPLAAPVYGGYASAGSFDLDLNGTDAPGGRFEIGDASDLVARAQTPGLSAAYAVSGDTGDDRQAASANASVALGSGRLTLSGVDVAATGGNAAGGGLTYSADARGLATAASLDMTQTAGSSLVALDAQVGSAGTVAGVRAIRATAPLDGVTATQFDAALYAALARQTAAGRVSSSLAWDHGSDAGLAIGAQGSALVGSLADDLRLSRQWSAHIGAASNLRIPTFAEVTAVAPASAASDRSLLLEEALTYTDLRRLRVAAAAYTQRTTGPAAMNVNGIGVDGAWQIAPALSLRSWVLIAHQSVPLAATGEYEPYAPLGVEGSDFASSLAAYATAPVTSGLSPKLVWFTYDRWIRVDALVRTGPLEGDVRIPVGPQYAVALGTAQYNGHRVTTFGVTLR